MEKEDMMGKTHQDEDLTRFFVSYFCWLKDGGHDLGYTNLAISLNTALGGLDTEFGTSQFVERARKDFSTIVSFLEEEAKRRYKEEQSKKGVYDSNSNLVVRYTTEQVARMLNITAQGVRKAIGEHRLAAKKEGNSYTITQRDLNDFISKSKKVKEKNK